MHKQAGKPPVPIDERSAGEVRILDPKKVTLFRAESGVPRMTLEGELSCLYLRVMCAFPLSKSNKFISLRDGLNYEIGLIEDLADLDRNSRKIAKEEIKRRYFLPEITAITSLDGHFGTYDWEVETDHGPREFLMRGRSESVIQMNPHRVLITDVLGNRYHVADWTQLDPRSIDLIYKVL